MPARNAGRSRPLAVIAREACIACGQCVPICPVDAISLDAEGIAVVAPERCTGCSECIQVCPTSAITMAGGPSRRPDMSAAQGHPAGEPSMPEADVRQELASCHRKSSPPEVWVFVEHTDGRPAPVSWELLGKARELADDLDGRVCAVVLGHAVDHLTRDAAGCGAEKVYLIDDPVLAHYRTQPYLDGLAALADKHRPEIMLLGATTMGRDLAGAVATRLRTGLTADCTGLNIDPNTKLLEQTRPAYGGNILATILCEHRRPQMATVRPRVMEMPTPDTSRAAEIVRGKLGLTEDDVPLCIVEHTRENPAEAVRIEDADILISGGHGLGGPEGFSMLERLAETIGGRVAGSRAAVDEGWIEHSLQVGQTGTTVRPKLYVACGISGAIQHLVGMQTSDVIVAINRDPNAPIFGVATYGIVGDVHQIVPALTRACKARLSASGGLGGEGG
jgi:electron transfer flavoprotein alpha subunit